MELVINRKRWGRGEGQGLLLNAETDKMCCLGFMGRTCGVTKPFLDGSQMPSDVPSDAVKRNQEFWEKLAKKDKFYEGTLNDTKLADRLANINDSTHIGDAVREKRIIAAFKKIGIAVTFKN